MLYSARHFLSIETNISAFRTPRNLRNPSPQTTTVSAPALKTKSVFALCLSFSIQGGSQ